MAIKLTFLGHAGFLITDGDWRLAIDPFLTGNPQAVHKPEDLNPTHIALTHGHADHIGDTVSIARRCGATVYAAFEVCNYLGEQGVENLEPGNPGGRIETDFGFIAFTQAFHSSSFEGRYMGQPCGVVARIGGVTLYHCGDTALFSDMKLIGELYRPHIAMIPVGDRFTMGPEHGARAAQLIVPKVAIPIHWGTWPLLTSDLSAFTPKQVEVKVMKPGETASF
ncbi:MAG: metal-dependent hydrolase [Phycisphaerales bacterium JB039]